MGTLADLSTEDVVARVLRSGHRGQGEVADTLSRQHVTAWAATDGRRLELCRVRMAMLLGCTWEATTPTEGAGVPSEVLAALPRWTTDDRFDAADRACLAFAEQYLVDVAGLDDATVEDLRAHLGDDATASFVHALLVVEQRIRLRLVWDRLFGGPQ